MFTLGFDFSVLPTLLKCLISFLFFIFLPTQEKVNVLPLLTFFLFSSFLFCNLHCYLNCFSAQTEFLSRQDISSLSEDSYLKQSVRTTFINVICTTHPV